jgi:putative transposase
MKKEWFSTQELVGAIGIPGTDRGIRDRAARDGWKTRKRSVGKGFEYHLSSLPEITQAWLISKAYGAEPRLQPRVSRPSGTRVNAKALDREGLWNAFERAPQSIKDEALEHLTIVQALMELRQNGVGKTKAVQQIMQLHDIGRSTLYRWMDAIKGVEPHDWLPLLARKYSPKPHSAACDEEAWDYFKSLYLTPEQRTIAACYEWTQQVAKEKGWAWPAKRTITRWATERITRTVRVLKREGENAMASLYPSMRRSVIGMYAMQWINGDGYKHNVFVRFPDGRIDRPKTWFWQDVYSRKILGFRTDLTEHSDMIRLALGDVIESYGIPEDATIDNTRAAANKYMTGGVKNRYRFKVKEEDPVGVMPALGIKIHWTSVHNGQGHGQAKPVERTFGVGGLGEYVDKHPRFAGAYTGPNVEAKPDNYASAAVEWDVFIAQLEQSIAAWNAKEGRRTEICGGTLSFDQAFEESYQRAADKIRRPTEAQRRMWLLAAEAVTVQRDATVRLAVGTGPHGKNHYTSDALIELVGQKVVVRFDPDSLHDAVYIYLTDGRYIGKAECQHAAGFGDTTKGREWARLRKQNIKAAKKAAENEVRMTDLEAAAYLPEVEPAPAPKTKVVRGAWESSKQAVGSDWVAEEESPADKHNFTDMMLKVMPRRTTPSSDD